ncbi:hypothetical protein C8R47DRAFT_993232 [Mycena vitilis]|nr:hypothetical protein C8R47DRAFT_993232 [Mycena vitilis]
MRHQDYPVKTWIPERDNCLDALIRREGRGPWWMRGCTLCKDPDPLWRCVDCFGGRMLCEVCVTERHRDEPLHLLEKWENNFFQPKTLRELGLRFQIGHPPGERCNFVHLTPPIKGFTVLHDNGIHIIDIDFCSCPGRPSNFDQLMAIGWYAATQDTPSTAASLSLLRRFHVLNLHAKVSAYDFYNCLVLLRNGAGLEKTHNRLPQFMTIVREFRHLQMGKRAGRCHDPLGLAGTKTGELSIDCRPCPHPAINLPDGWQDAPPEVAWIYRLMLSKDANFKLKGRDRSSRDKDPTLGPGWAYMVANDAYLKHLSKYVSEDEITHCVSFAALWSANNKRAKGLRASGIGSVSCSRHEMFRPVGTGDLQRGERYCNMDYLWFSSVMGIMLLAIVSSYDIACQWGLNFWERAVNMPKHMKLPPWIQVIFKVPKFHLPPHVKKCHSPYSFNYTKGVGRTDGEGVERNWAWLNRAARFISVMGPGGRDDTIDDLCGWTNWRKTVDLGNSLLRKLVLAIPEAMVHSRAFAAFTDGLREAHEPELREWEQIVRAWEADETQPSTKPDPYAYADVEGETIADVMLRISQDEHARVAENGAAALLVKPAAFLMAGIDIEEDQAAVRLEAKRKTRTTIQATALQRQRTLLLGKVSALRDVQETYMPGLRAWVGQQNPPLPRANNAKPETIEIYLPSAIPPDVRAAVCVPGLVQHEDDLRNAQALEALGDLRSGLRTRMFANQFKRRLTSSQGSFTKSRTLTDSIEDRIRAAAARYRSARAALLQLRGAGDWEDVLKVLNKADIRGMNERAMNDEEKAENKREGRRQLSWIWYTSPSGSDTTADGKLHDDIKVEWMKARARAERWREEVILVEEEMRRTLAYCQWKGAWWMARVAPVRPETRRAIDPQLAEGLRAYALEQAARERKWEAAWSEKWAAVRQRGSLVLQDHLVQVTDDLMVPLEVELDDGVDEQEEYGGEEDDEEEQ